MTTLKVILLEDLIGNHKGGYRPMLVVKAAFSAPQASDPRHGRGYDGPSKEDEGQELPQKDAEE